MQVYLPMTDVSVDIFIMLGLCSLVLALMAFKAAPWRHILGAVLLLAAGPALAQESIVVDLSQNRVDITATFSGSDIFVFGAVKRDTPLPKDASPLDVAIVIEGPLKTAMVHKKVHKFGIWMNSKAVAVQQAPSFFTIATTRPLKDILNQGDRSDYAIGLDYAVRPQESTSQTPDIEDYRKAVIRIRKEEGLYSRREGIVNLTADTLFESDIPLPANLVEGDYTARIYLIRDKNIVANTSLKITVRKAGLEAWLYNLAHKNALLYALLSITVALVAGYGASAIFRRLKR